MTRTFATSHSRQSIKTIRISGSRVHHVTNNSIATDVRRKTAGSVLARGFETGAAVLKKARGRAVSAGLRANSIEAREISDRKIVGRLTTGVAARFLPGPVSPTAQEGRTRFGPVRAAKRNGPNTRSAA